jgi:NADPH:quinone reductase-like Zn-dependent oxidoreductase
MKSIRVHTRSDYPEQILYEDSPQPYPNKGEILIRVIAAGVTPTELSWPGIWKTENGCDRPLPIVPGYEMSGVIEEICPGTRTAVYGIINFSIDGAAAEYVIATPSEVALKPQSIDYIQAAAVPLSGLTAWQALFEQAHLSPEQSILIHGAAGGVGTFAVQFSRWIDAYVIGTCSTRNKDFLCELGVDNVIDYKTTRFEDVVHDVDIVLDTVGGETLERSWRVLKKGGILVSVSSSLDIPSEKKSIQSYLREKGAAHGVHAIWHLVHPDREQLTKIGKLIDSGYVKPVIDKVVPLSEAAHKVYGSAINEHIRGKIVLHIGDRE